MHGLPQAILARRRNAVNGASIDLPTVVQPLRPLRSTALVIPGLHFPAKGKEAG